MLVLEGHLCLSCFQVWTWNGQPLSAKGQTVSVLGSRGCICCISVPNSLSCVVQNQPRVRMEVSGCGCVPIAIMCTDALLGCVFLLACHAWVMGSRETGSPRSVQTLGTERGPGISSMDEGTEGKRRTKRKRTPHPTSQMGHMGQSSGPLGCPNAKGRKNKQLTCRDHNPLSFYKCLNNL